MKDKISKLVHVIFRDEKSIKDVMNFVVSLIIILAAALLISNNFFRNDGGESPVIPDRDSIEIDEENLYINEEQRMSDILSKVKGVGSTKVMITYRENERRSSEVAGVIVVAEGAGDDVIKDRIIKTAQAAYNLPVNRIIVMESGK